MCNIFFSPQGFICHIKQQLFNCSDNRNNRDNFIINNITLDRDVHINIFHNPFIPEFLQCTFLSLNLDISIDSNWSFSLISKKNVSHFI